MQINSTNRIIARLSVGLNSAETEILMEEKRYNFRRNLKISLVSTNLICHSIIVGKLILQA